MSGYLHGFFDSQFGGSRGRKEGNVSRLNGTVACLVLSCFHGRRLDYTSEYTRRKHQGRNTWTSAVGIVDEYIQAGKIEPELTTEQAAELLGISRSAVIRLFRSGHFDAREAIVGSGKPRYFFTERSILDYKNGYRSHQKETAVPRARHRKLNLKHVVMTDKPNPPERKKRSD